MSDHLNYEHLMSGMPGWHLRRMLRTSGSGSSELALIEDQNGNTSMLYILDAGSAPEMLPDEYPQEMYELQYRPYESSREQESPQEELSVPRPRDERIRALDSRSYIPGTLSIYEYQDTGAGLLIRTEAYRSMDLLLRTQPSASQLTIASFGMELCTALHSLHRSGMIHRSIHYRNIFLTPDRKWLLSNPLTEPLEPPAAAPSRETMFWSPEQFQGLCDERSDIYSLGLILYTLLNGNRLPFHVKDVPLERAISLRSVNNPFPIPKMMDEKLGQVLQKACAFYPQDRYQTAEEFRHALGSCVQKLYLESDKRPMESKIILQTRDLLIPACLLFSSLTVIACIHSFGYFFYEEYLAGCALFWLAFLTGMFSIASMISYRRIRKASELASKKDYAAAFRLGIPERRYQSQIITDIRNRSLNAVLKFQAREALEIILIAKPILDRSEQLRSVYELCSSEFQAEILLEQDMLTHCGKKEHADRLLRDALTLLPDSKALNKAYQDLCMSSTGGAKQSKRRKAPPPLAWMIIAWSICFFLSMFICNHIDVRNYLLNVAAHQPSDNAIVILHQHPLMRRFDSKVRAAYKDVSREYIDLVIANAEYDIQRNAHAEALTKIEQALEFHPDDERLLAQIAKISGSHVDYLCSSAAKMEDAGDYISAYETLCDGLVIYPDEERMLLDKDRLKHDYIEQVGQDMAACLKNYNYSASESLVNKALSLLPEDETLLNYRAYLDEIKPIRLCDLSLASTHNWIYDHNGNATFNDRSDYSSVSHHAKGDYVLLTMDISGFLSNDLNNEVCVTVYGDDIQLYTSGWFDDSNLSTRSAVVDITDCQFVRITVDNTNVDTSPIFVSNTIQLANIYVWKTLP